MCTYTTVYCTVLYCNYVILWKVSAGLGCCILWITCLIWHFVLSDVPQPCAAALRLRRPLCPRVLPQVARALCADDGPRQLPPLLPGDCSHQEGMVQQDWAGHPPREWVVANVIKVEWSGTSQLVQAWDKGCFSRYQRSTVSYLADIWSDALAFTLKKTSASDRNITRLLTVERWYLEIHLSLMFLVFTWWLLTNLQHWRACQPINRSFIAVEPLLRTPSGPSWPAVLYREVSLMQR